MTEATPTVPPSERARFFVVFEVARDQVDMEDLQQRLYDVIDLGGFQWDVAVSYAPREGGQQ